MSPMIYYLKNKLTWMASKLRWINNDKEIISWIAAMEAVHKLLVEASLRKEMLQKQETKTRRWKTAFETREKTEGKEHLIHPKSVDQISKKGKGRPVVSEIETKKEELTKIRVKDKQTSPLKENLVSIKEQIPEKAKPKTRNTRTVVRGIRTKLHREIGPVKSRCLETRNPIMSVVDRPMEFKDDDSKLDQERLQRSKKKVKEWWERALWRK